MLTFALGGVKTFPKRLRRVPTGTSRPNGTEGSKMLRLIDDLNKTRSKGLWRNLLTVQERTIKSRVPLSTRPKSHSPVHRLNCRKNEMRMWGPGAYHAHVHYSFTKPIPQPTGTDETSQSHASSFGFECIPDLWAKGCWDIEIGPVAVKLLIGSCII